MLNSKKLIMAALLAVTFSSAVHADTVGVQASPGWNRGDALSGFIEFDDFSVATGESSSTANGGSLSGGIEQLSGGIPFFAGLLGSSPDNRVYDGGVALNWSIDATSTSDVNFLQLQVKEALGFGLGSLSVFANGEAADGFNVFDDGFGNAITSFLWELDSTITAGTAFDVTLTDLAGNNHFSYDSFSLDASAVPLPAAVWLFGSALIGLVGVRRKPTLA